MTSGPIDRVEARRRANDILSQRRFRRARQPATRSSNPSWLERHIGRPIGRMLQPIARIIFSGPGLVVIGLVVLALALVAGRRQLARRASQAVGIGGRRSATPIAIDAQALEAEAEAAEASGQLGLAVQLRFRAGLVRLDTAGAITLGPETTSGQVGRMLRNERYDRLALRFDAVAYGDDPATRDDTVEARSLWPNVLEAAGARG